MVWYIGRATSTADCCCCTEPLGEKKHFCFRIIPLNLIRPSSLLGKLSQGDLSSGGRAPFGSSGYHSAAAEILGCQKRPLQSGKAPKKKQNRSTERNMTDEEETRLYIKGYTSEACFFFPSPSFFCFTAEIAGRHREGLQHVGRRCRGNRLVAISHQSSPSTPG